MDMGNTPQTTGDTTQTSGRHRGLPWLVGDIGGTNARFGWINDQAGQIQHVRTLPVADHSGPAEAVQAYLAYLAGLGAQAGRPQRAALAVATAVTGDEIELTNAHWRFSCTALRDALGWQSLEVLNDFEALALSLPTLLPRQLRMHARAASPQDGTAAQQQADGIARGHRTTRRQQETERRRCDRTGGWFAGARTRSRRRVFSTSL